MPDQQAVLKAIQNPTRIKILKFLGDIPHETAYSDLLPFCEGSTGKLNYHLRTMGDLVNRSESGYQLSAAGRKALNWIQSYSLEPSTELDRPEVVYNKIYPDSSLRHKFMIQFSLIAVWVLIAALLLAFYASIWVPLFLLLAGYAICLVLIDLYVKSIWYRITETEVEVFKGIITHTHKIVPFRTITNVDLKQGPFDRIWGISTVEVHTAGASSQQVGPEERIGGMIEGEEIKDTIVERIRLLNPITQLQGSAAPNYLMKTGLLQLKQELEALNREMSTRDQ